MSEHDSLAFRAGLEIGQRARQDLLARLTRPAEAAAPPALPWAPTVAAYLTWGRLSGGKKGRPWAPLHARMQADRLRWWEARLPANLLDLRAQHVEAGLALLLKDHAGASAKRYHETIKALVNWCVKRDQLPKDPLRAVRAPNADPVKLRRELTREECGKLLAIAPPRRRLLYIVALATALRRNELASIRAKHISTDPPGLRLDPAWTKDRKPGFQPLPADLAQALAAAGRLSLTTRPVRELRKDLKRAGINPQGVDFHSLRVTAITLFEQQAGANETDIRAFGRHATLVSSMRYRKSGVERIALLQDQMMKGIEVSPSSSPAQDIRFSA